MDRLAEVVDRCERNEIFALRALNCTVKVQEESRQVAANLFKKFSQGGQSQSGNMASNAKNLQLADTALAELEGRSELAIEDTLRYLLNLAHPDELYELEPSADASALLKGTPCFSKNKRKLLIALTELEKNKNGLILARNVLKDLAARSKEDIHGMFQSALGPLLKSSEQLGKGSASSISLPNKKAKNSQSDITGTIREKTP